MPDPCRGMVRWYECANESRAIRNWLKEPLLSGCLRGREWLRRAGEGSPPAEWFFTGPVLDCARVE